MSERYRRKAEERAMLARDVFKIGIAVVILLATPSVDGLSPDIRTGLTVGAIVILIESGAGILQMMIQADSKYYDDDQGPLSGLLGE